MPQATPARTMEDDTDTDTDLLTFMRRALGFDSNAVAQKPTTTGVLSSARFICDNAIDVALDMASCKAAAETIYTAMQSSSFSTKSWSQHPLHPTTKDEEQVKFIFMMDLLNFSFWSEKNEEERFAVEYRGQRHTGYWSLVACIQRALDEGIPVTDPYFWVDDSISPDAIWHHVFRSNTNEAMSLMDDRIACLREAGEILCEKYDGRFVNCIHEANGSAVDLVNLVVGTFPCFNDISRFEDQTVKFHKRAQILVADLWASFDCISYGRFDDIDQITMFADYRVPVMLHTFGCMSYSPSLEYHIREHKNIPHNSTWEIELRGCSIHCVELIRREIIKRHAEAEGTVNAILIDFFLYDTAKALEKEGSEMIPHHRTRSIWY